MRGLCFWKRQSQRGEKKLLIRRVVDDRSWPPIGQSTSAADEQDVLLTAAVTRTVVASDVSLYSR